MLCPWFSLPHPLSNCVALCREIVLVLCDFLLQAVAVVCDICAAGFGCLCYSHLPVVLTLLEGSHGVV